MTVKQRTLRAGHCLRIITLSIPLTLAGTGCTTNPSAVMLTPEQKQMNAESFDYVWQSVHDSHWDRDLIEERWIPLRDEYEHRVETATTMAEVRELMGEMIERLEQTHFGVIPAEAYDDLDGDSDAENEDSDSDKEGDAGFDIRILNGKAIVTRVFPGMPAEDAGIKPGWELLKAGSRDIPDMLERLSENLDEGSTRRMVMNRAIVSRLRGDVGDSLSLEFSDAAERRVSKSLKLAPRRGKEVDFGNLPGMYVWFESKKLEPNIGYMAFSAFFDPSVVMAPFGKAVKEFRNTDGIIVDLRGNPGGLGAMAMGIASWFFDGEKQQLGVMRMRDQDLKFVLFPRRNAFHGPVVVLVDGLTASTSEIFAGGMQDLDRAVVIGTPTAGAALPSRIDRLPNGDGFQYAMANYISAGGAELEDNGVIPDMKIEHTREALLSGRDLAVEAAIHWIQSQGSIAISTEGTTTTD